MDLRAWIPQRNLGIDPRILPLGPDDRAVLTCVNGQRSIAEVLRDAGLPSQRVLRSLVKLHDLAALQAAPVEVAAALAAFRPHAGAHLPSPVPLDPPVAKPDAGDLLPPPPWESADFDRRPSAFSAVPTETELPIASAPAAPAMTAAAEVQSARFEESDPTLVEEEEPLPVPAERTVVDARVLSPEPESQSEDDDWDEEPGTLQDSTLPDNDG